MNVSLVRVTADGKSREVPLTRFPVLLGRGEECKVRIPLPAISRRHCELSLDDDELVVKDLRSANGTYVNGLRVRARELVPGDLLAVGPVVFVVRLNGHPREIDARECYIAGMVEPRDQAPPGSADESGSDSSSAMGVPAWPSGGSAGQKTAAPDAAAKPGAKKPDEDDDLGSLLADLDLSGLDDDEEEAKK